MRPTPGHPRVWDGQALAAKLTWLAMVRLLVILGKKIGDETRLAARPSRAAGSRRAGLRNESSGRRASCALRASTMQKSLPSTTSPIHNVMSWS